LGGSESEQSGGQLRFGKPSVLCCFLVAMSDGLLVKVQFPPGSLKKTATVKLSSEMTVMSAVVEIAKAGHLSRPEQYLLYCAEGSKRKWLSPQQTLQDQGISAQVRLALGSVDLLVCRCVCGSAVACAAAAPPALRLRFLPLFCLLLLSFVSVESPC